MFPKALRCALLLTALAIAVQLQGQVPSSFNPPIAVLRSAHADGSISESHARLALWYAATELKVASETIPRILVIHGGEDVAVAGAWPSTSNHRSSGAVLVEPTTSGGKVYYLWIFGKPSDEILARGFVEILQKEVGLPDHDFATPAKHVVARLGSVVSADELQKGMFPSQH